MATTLEKRSANRPGPEVLGETQAKMHIAPSEGFFGYHAENDFALAKGKIALGSQFPGHGYQVDDETQTLNSGTIAMGAGGLVFTSAASTAEVVSQSIRSHTPAAGQRWKATCRIASTTAATCGFTFGFGATDTTPIASDATDLVAFVVANNSAAITARVKGNNGTARDITSFNTTPDSVASGTPGAVSLVDATQMELGVEYYLGSTEALSWGNWWVNGYRTKFSALQVTALFAILTSPPAMHRRIGIQGDGSARVVTVQYMFSDADR